MWHIYDFRHFLGRSYDTEDILLLSLIAKLSDAGVILKMEGGPWLAGGAVRRTLAAEDMKGTDLDLFFEDEIQADKVEEVVSKMGEVKLLGKKEGRVSDYLWQIDKDTQIKIQIVRMMYYSKPEDVLDFFDFTICQALTDGKTLMVGQNTLWDLARRRLAIHKVTYGVSTVRRMLKYNNQGFNTCPGMIADLLEQIAQNPEAIHREVKYVD